MTHLNYHLFEKILHSVPQADYPHYSRVHRLKSFDTADCQCYVKREDELGFGISGSKIRKYRSLIPFLLQQQANEAIVIGGAYSNHVLGITQLLIENKITPTLFLREHADKKIKGNLSLLFLLVNEQNIHWIPRNEWMNVQTIALDYAEKQKLSNKKIFILEEGGSQLESLPGALSLPLDILRNQNDLQLHFDHIIIETGTGMMASTLILGMNLLQSRLKAHIHVLLLAGDESSFHQQLHKWHHSFNALVNLNSPFPQNFTLHRPNQAPSFGSTNQRIFEEIRILGQTEGFFCDPIYSGKLMLESRKLLHDQKMQGDVLLIHSGGGLTLMGFQNKLLKNY